MAKLTALQAVEFVELPTGRHATIRLNTADGGVFELNGKVKTAEQEAICYVVAAALELLEAAEEAKSRLEAENLPWSVRTINGLQKAIDKANGEE